MEPDNTAVRVALWRALHVEIDPPPHVLADEIGLQLVAPEAGWQRRRDMSPEWTSRNRASIVARARFVEDLVAGQADAGISQYVILGAGLDTFAQRRAEFACQLLATRCSWTEVPTDRAHFGPFRRDFAWLSARVSGRAGVASARGTPRP